MSYKKRTTRTTKPGRKREKWTDIFPRYLTFISHMRPILRETRRIIINLDADLLLDTEILDKILAHTGAAGRFSNKIARIVIEIGA